MRSKFIYAFLLCVFGCTCNAYKAGNLEPENKIGKWTDAPQWPPESTFGKKSSPGTENKFQDAPIAFNLLRLFL